MRANAAARVYLALVVALGAIAVGLAMRTCLRQPPGIDFVYLAVLTVVSGFLPIKVPRVSANISVSETFVYAGTLLLGTSAGVMLVVLDALVIWVKIGATTNRSGIKWQRMAFSIAASALSIGVAGYLLFRLIGVAPLAYLPLGQRPDVWVFAGGLIVFAGIYFLWNSALVAVAIAIEQGLNAFQIWRGNFSNLWTNYLAGASIALLLVFNTTRVTPAFLLVILPIIFVMALTHRATAKQIEETERHLEQMNRTFLQTIEAFALAVDAKDQVTHGHIRRVQRHTMALAAKLGVTDPALLDALRAAALLHDTGKLAVPEYILNKPGRLTPAEFEKMKLHASIGADILRTIDFPYPIEPIVRHHHENWDGTGYPAGLRGTDIPIGARILSVVDCYDAVRSTRPYRSGMSREESARVVRDRRGTMYDPEIVDAFLGMLDELEAIDSAERPGQGAVATALQPIEAIKAAVREQRQFEEAARVSTGGAAPHLAEALLTHCRIVAPVETVVVFQLQPGTFDLVVSSSAGRLADELARLTIPVGERIAGWVYAHQQSVLNSEAALDLGMPDVTLPAELAYALVMPVLGHRDVLAVAAIYGPERFTESQRQLFEFAVGLLRLGLAPNVSSVSTT